MSIQFRFCAHCVSVVLASALICGFAYGQSNTPLSGSYGFMLSESFINSENEKGLTFVGVMNLDGAGTVSATATLQNGAGPRHAAETGSIPLAGTYSTNPDGTGNLKLGVEGDLTLTFAMVITDGGQSLQLVATDCSIGPDSCGGPFTSVFTGVARATKGGAASLNGSYGFQFNTAPVPSTAVGVLKFDGAGNATMSFTRVGTSNDPSITVAPVSSGTMSGAYSIKPDGTGTIVLKASSAQSPDLTIAFVVTDSGSGLLLIRTEAGTPNSNVEFGSARLQ